MPSSIQTRPLIDIWGGGGPRCNGGDDGDDGGRGTGGRPCFRTAILPACSFIYVVITFIRRRSFSRGFYVPRARRRRIKPRKFISRHTLKHTRLPKKKKNACAMRPPDVINSFDDFFFFIFFIFIIFYFLFFSLFQYLFIYYHYYCFFFSSLRCRVSRVALTVFVVVTPNVHELVRGEFFQFAAVWVSVLFHEVCRFF